MPSTDPNTSLPGLLNIAGIRFVLSAPLAVCPPFFQEFVGEVGPADLLCDVYCQGADETLAIEQPEPDIHWQFRKKDDGCELTRRAVDGVPLWRVRASSTFDRASVYWHPQRFEHVYRDYPTAWSMGLGSSLVVFRLHACGGLMLHATAADVDGRGIVCAGVSGVGKSTIAKLLHAVGATVLTDEHPVVRQWPAPDGEVRSIQPAAAFRVHGSPWPSAAGFARHACAPLQRIYFLEHGAENRLTPLTPREAFTRFIPVAMIPWHDATFFDPCLQTLESLLRIVPCAVLSFRPTSEVVDLIRQDLAEPLCKAIGRP